MEAKITRPDGTMIEVNGTPDEVTKLVASLERAPTGNAPRERLKALLIRSGLSIVELCELMNLDKKHEYSQYECETHEDKPIPYETIKGSRT
jgi:hypothetical protein